MSLLAIIPARAGSKRLPGKNFMLINGKSLLQRAIECAKEAGIFDHILVSTDDYTALRVARDHNVFTRERPKILCDDNVQTAAVVFDALGYENYVHDEFCVLNPTTPTRTAEDLRNGYKWFRAHDSWCLASLTNVLEKHDGAFLFANTLEFLRRMKILDDETFWMPSEQVDINTKADFDRAEKILIEREGDRRICQNATT